MVLTCSLPAKNEPLVLDTAEPEVLPVSGRSDLVPVYSFNSGGYWLARREKNWQGERLGRATMLSKWQALLRRVETEGTRFVGFVKK